ncbi:MAG TPA: ATP-binding protein [Gemmatimonadales bacterium]|nr:ATP-binding protein [Gemmatimonadales bacterium]
MSRSSSTRTTSRSPAQVLSGLTELARELAGAYRPSTVVERVAAWLLTALTPDKLTVLALDGDTNSLAVAYDRGGDAAHIDDPLLQLALRRGPTLLSRDVAKAAAAAGAAPLGTPPGSWMGAPLVTVGRAIGVIALASDRPGAYGPPQLALLNAVVAQAAIALENARLLELLSSGKREWELTVDAISQAICIIDPQGIVRRSNRVFADLVKVPVTALPGRAWLTLVPPAWASVVTRALAEPGAHEIRSGERVYLVSAVRMEGADAGSAVLSVEDHTEKRRLQDQLIQSEKMSAIGQLISGIAHDLNNPLASVVGFADYLAESEDVPPALAEPLRVIRQEAERAATIVKNLLSFARRQEGERVPQALRPLIESVLALLRNQLMALKVDAVLDVEPGTPEIEMNVNQIKQVFVNLLNNAAQAIASTGRPGHIQISARKWLDGVSVSVADDGPGIPEELVPRVFEPFFTTKGEGEGTGLGLSICQGIVKEHGGRITLESSLGHGATFTVELLGGRRPARPSQEEAAPASSGRLRILVVDDEPHILHYMKATLASWGHAVEVATDGTEAVERALVEPFDVIICDLRMPRLGGREMYDNLASAHPDIARRVIFATGDTVRGDTLQFLESLHRPFLHKPFTLAELRTVLGRVTPSTATSR